MSIFDETVGVAKAAANITAKKTGELLELTKLNVKAADMQNAMDKLYFEIGKIVYLASKNEMDQTEQIDEKILVIDELGVILRDFRSQIANLRGKIICPQCGAENTKDSNFCKKCACEFIKE